MVQLADYNYLQSGRNEVLFGHGSTGEDLDSLNKAVSAGSITGRETTNLTNASGAPLKVESLEKSLKVLTYQTDHAKFWKNISKTPAFNTVEEYNQLVSYGQERGGFNAEGELPQEEDSTYVRRAQLVKFMGTVRSVTHPMSLVNVIGGDIIDRQVREGTLWLIRKADKALFSGDEGIIPEEFNGVFTQHRNNDDFTNLSDYHKSDVVIDLHGKVLNEKAIEVASEGIVENFGLGNQLYAPPKVFSDFSTNFYGNKFIQPNTGALVNATMGQKVKSFESQYGNIDFNWDIFLKPGSPKVVSTSGATSPFAPATPTPTSATAGAGDPDSEFLTGDDGNYCYAVSAINKYGESALVNVGTAATVAVGGRVDLIFAAGAGPNATSGYRIYRTLKGGTTTDPMYPIFEVSVANLAAGFDGAAALAIRDRNRFMPNTQKALLIQQTPDIVEFKQLAPLMKMDLAITSPAYRFMMLLYGTPFLYAPKKAVLIKNIGYGTV